MFGGSERAPGIQRRRDGPIVRPKVDARNVGDKCGLCKIGPNLESERAGVRLRVSRRAGATPGSQFAKRNKPACRSIPQHEGYAGQTLTQCEPADIREIGVLAKSKRQPVERDSAAEVVNMMHADVGGEPAQHGR